MKTRGFIYGILLILGLSLIGLLFYYGMWMLTDAYFRQEFLKEWPWHSWENSAKPFCKVDTKKGRPLRLAPPMSLMDGKKKELDLGPILSNRVIRR
jgi:hypothetical protein